MHVTKHRTIDPACLENPRPEGAESGEHRFAIFVSSPNTFFRKVVGYSGLHLHRQVSYPTVTTGKLVENPKEEPEGMRESTRNFREKIHSKDRDPLHNETNIGLNPLTSEKPIWYAGPDIVGSLLQTGRPPKILRAIRFEPVGVQKEMKSVNLGQASINPARDDFFRKVVEERKGKKKSDPLYYFLKIVASAGCYGIYAEVNRVQTGKNDAKQVGIFSGEMSMTERTCIVETPGP